MAPSKRFKTNIYSKETLKSNSNKHRANFLLVLTIFSIILILSTFSVDAFTWNRPTIVAATLNVNHSVLC